MYTISTTDELSSVRLYERLNSVFVNAFKKGELVFEYDRDSNIEMHKSGDLTYQFKIINALSKRPINRKSADETQNKKLNPFLKNEPDLTVCDIFLQDYKLLLNKFPNCENHFLMVTREFVKQDTLLSGDDLYLINLVLRNLNADSDAEFFSFFNSGHQSGYSQIHKHIQFLTFPNYTLPGSLGIHKFKPFIDTFVKDYQYTPDLQPLTRPDISFKHFVLPLPSDPSMITPQLLSKIYHSLLEKVLELFKYNKLLKDESLLINNELNPDISYNFIATERYMMLIPRSAAKFDDCWANSLQFMGLFSAKNQEIKKKILDMGFQEFLVKVGFKNETVQCSL